MNHFHDYTTTEDRLNRRPSRAERVSEIYLNLAIATAIVYAVIIFWNIRELNVMLLELGI